MINLFNVTVTFFLSIILTKIIFKTANINLNLKRSYLSNLFGYYHIFSILIIFHLIEQFKLHDLNNIIIASFLSSFSIYLIHRFLLNNKLPKSLDKLLKLYMGTTILASFLITAFIVYSLTHAGLGFFDEISFFDLFSTQWESSKIIKNPYEAKFGIFPLILGSVVVSFIAVIFSLPIGVLGACYIAEYASTKFNNIVKYLIEFLISIPTIVYGYLAITQIDPIIKNYLNVIGIDVNYGSALTAGVTVSLLLLPIILSMTDDVIRSIPMNIKESAMALGSTKMEILLKIILPTSSNALLNILIIVISRAIGETMIVSMVMGLSADFTINPLNSMSTITVQITNLVSGDHHADSLATQAAFILSLILFIITLILNSISMLMLKKFHANIKNN